MTTRGDRSFGMPARYTGGAGDAASRVSTRKDEF